MITILFLILIPFAAPLSFNFSSFTPNDANINYESSAYPANNVIQLTRNQRDSTTLASTGRATYAKPLQLWDKSSGNLTDFTTHFSFIINSLNSSAYGDGFVFFLAPNGSRIPNNVTEGGSMALTPDSEPVNSTNNPFFAVEFDIYSNPWDPPNEHVGVDISSMRSVANATWWSAASIRKGWEHDAWINYDSATKNLSLRFSAYRNHTAGNYTKVTRRLYYIVDLREHLPELVTFGFSAATGNASALHSISSWSFSSNLEINDPNSGRNTSGSTDPGTVPDSSKNKIGLVVGLAVGGLFLLGGITGLIVFALSKKGAIFKRRVNGEDDMYDVTIGDEFERGSGPKRFSYNELARATNKFALHEKLGEGGFGGVYKGFLNKTNSNIAVKRVSQGSCQGIKEYSSEVKIISRLRHRNLVQLLGWCHEKKELLLVYEFMPNGSLDSHLFKGKSLLDWDVRFKIAQGLASALLYLHEEWEQCVVHRDIKSSNVMLDSNCNAKLGDFGLARLVDHGKGSQTTVLAGTMGYMAPECVITGKASKETDVFSFGVVALEIATGRRPIDHQAVEKRVSLVEWAWSLYGTGKTLEAADGKLGNDFDVREMELLIVVGLWCAHPDSNIRPSIRQAILVLNSEAPLPVPRYCDPSLDMMSHAKTGSSSMHSDITASSKFTTSSEASSPSATLLYSR